MKLLRSAYLIKLNDIGVADLLQYFDFTGDPLHVLLVLDLVFLEDLDSDLLPGEGVRGLLDLTKCTLAK